MTHKILIEPEELLVIKIGRKKHHLCHVSTKMYTGDEVCFYLAYSPSSDTEVNVRVTYIDTDLPGFNNNHFIFSFELI